MSVRMSGCIVAVLMSAGTVLGEVGVVVELLPSNPGPYIGGEQVTVDVWLHSQSPRDLAITFVQLDFTATDPALSLDAELTFDYSSAGDGAQEWLASDSPQLPVPWAFYSPGCFCPGDWLQLPSGASLHIGSIGVLLPPTAGSYVLDVLNGTVPYVLPGGGGARCGHVGGRYNVRGF